MSTKIYGGLISQDTDPFESMKNIRRVLEPHFFKKFSEICDIYQDVPEGSRWDYVSRFFLDDEDIVPVSSSAMMRNLYEKIVELEKDTVHTFSDANIFYSAFLLPNANKGNPLVLIFGEKSEEYTNLLLESGVVKEYGYWDNSDEPDDVSKKEWKERKLAWSTLNEGTPASNGLRFDPPSHMETFLFMIERNRKRRENRN